MKRALPHPDERLLNAEEAGQRVHLSEPSFWRIAADNPILLAGRRVQGRRTFWLASAVARYCDSLPTTSPLECNLGSYARERQAVSP